MSFDIQIRVDPGDSVTKIKGVTDGLTQAEQRGKAAGEAMLGVGAAFKSVAQAMQQEQSALARTNELHEQLAVKNSGLVGSFNGLTQAMQRERDMLTAIRGPAEQLAKDTETLNSMMARGVITTKEYEAQLEKLSSTTNQASSAGGSRGISLLGAQFGLGGIGSAVGLAGGAAGAILAGRELMEINDKYVELSNSAMRFTDASHNVDQVLIEQRQLARDLHMDLGQSMEGYEKVREAAEDLNLSTEDTIRLDKSYTEAAVLNGRSTEDLAQQMQNLNVAFQTGTDASRPLRAIFKEFPELAKQWEGSLGLTERQIFQLAKTGQLSFGDLERATITATDALDQKFGKRVKTTQQTWDEFKDDVERPIPDMGTLFDETRWTNLDSAQKKAIENAERQAHALVVTVNGIKSVTDLTQDVLDTLDKYDDSLTRIEGHLKSGEYATALAKGIQAIVDKTKDVGEVGLKLIGGDDPWDPDKLKDKLAAIKNYHHELTTEEQLLKSIQAPMVEANHLIADSADLYANGAISVQQWGDEVRKAQALAGTEPPVRSVVSGEGGDFFTPFHNQPGIGTPTPDFSDFSPDKSRDVFMQQVGENAGIDFNTAVAENQLKALEKTSTESAVTVGETWKRAMGQVNKSIVDMATTGTVNFDSLMSSIERMLAELALAKLESGVASFFKSSAAPQQSGLATVLDMAPMFATGGSGTVPGTGAPDSQLFIAKVSPGEHYEFTPSGQMDDIGRKGGQSSSGGGHTINNFNFDPRRLRSGRDLEAGVYEAVRRNPSAFRQLVGRG